MTELTVVEKWTLDNVDRLLERAGEKWATSGDTLEALHYSSEAIKLLRAQVAELQAKLTEATDVLEDFVIHYGMGWELDDVAARARAALTKTELQVGSLDDGVPNHLDQSQRGFVPK
jgi:hypothetical protein